MSNAARNLKVINAKSRRKSATTEYFPTSLEIRHDALVTNVRKARKSLRQESIRLRKSALAVMLLSVASMGLWVYFATYARDLLNIGAMIILGVIGVACVVGTMSVAAIMTSASYTLEEEAKKLSKEV